MLYLHSSLNKISLNQEMNILLCLSIQAETICSLILNNYILTSKEGATTIQDWVISSQNITNTLSTYYFTWVVRNTIEMIENVKLTNVNPLTRGLRQMESEVPLDMWTQNSMMAKMRRRMKVSWKESLPCLLSVTLVYTAYIYIY